MYVDSDNVQKVKFKADWQKLFPNMNGICQHAFSVLTGRSSSGNCSDSGLVGSDTYFPESSIEDFSLKLKSELLHNHDWVDKPVNSTLDGWVDQDSIEIWRQRQAFSFEC